MERNKTTCNFRNKLSIMAMDCDSMPFVGSATSEERRYIQDTLRSLVNYIDKRI